MIYEIHCKWPAANVNGFMVQLVIITCTIFQSDLHISQAGGISLFFTATCLTATKISVALNTGSPRRPASFCVKNRTQPTYDKRNLFCNAMNFIFILQKNVWLALLQSKASPHDHDTILHTLFVVEELCEVVLSLVCAARFASQCLRKSKISTWGWQITES